MPPASSIASLADAENLAALTVNFLVNLEPPRTLTPHKVFLISPASINSTALTTAPFSNLASKSATLTIAYSFLVKFVNPN